MFSRDVGWIHVSDECIPPSQASPLIKQHTITKTRSTTMQSKVTGQGHNKPSESCFFFFLNSIIVRLGVHTIPHTCNMTLASGPESVCSPSMAPDKFSKCHRNTNAPSRATKLLRTPRTANTCPDRHRISPIPSPPANLQIVFQPLSHLTCEHKNRAINTRLTEDRLTAARAKHDKPFTDIVKATWDPASAANGRYPTD